MIRTIGGAIALLTLAGCHAQLEPVRIAGAAGQALSAHQLTVGGIAAGCLEVATLAGASDECGDLRESARSWGRVVGLLGEYAQGLESPGLSAPSGAAGDDWPGLSPAQAGAAKALSDAVRAGVEPSAGESELRDLVARTDAAVQELARGLDDLARHEISRLDLARGAIDVVRARLQEVSAAGSPSRRAGAAAASSAPAAGGPPPRGPDKGVAAIAAEVAPVREGVAALRARLDESLLQRETDRAADRQTAVPGALAELGLMQGDLETKRARLEHLRDAIGAFARVHKALHDDPGATPGALARAAARPAPAPSARQAPR